MGYIYIYIYIICTILILRTILEYTWIKWWLGWQTWLEGGPLIELWPGLGMFTWSYRPVDQSWAFFPNVCGCVHVYRKTHSSFMFIPRHVWILGKKWSPFLLICVSNSFSWVLPSPYFGCLNSLIPASTMNSQFQIFIHLYWHFLPSDN